MRNTPHIKKINEQTKYTQETIQLQCDWSSLMHDKISLKMWSKTSKPITKSIIIIASNPLMVNELGDISF